MKIVMLFAAFAWGLSLTTQVMAEGMDDGTKKALDETLGVLLSPQQRQELISKDKKALEADQFAFAVGGNAENQQKIYELSAKIMKDLAEKTGGSPEEMMKLLEQAQKDPASFASKFSVEQQKELKDLAAEIERTRGNKPLPALQ